MNYYGVLAIRNTSITYTILNKGRSYLCPMVTIQMKTTVLLLYILVLFQAAHALPNQVSARTRTVVEELSNWQVYDEEAQINVPFLPGYHLTNKSIFHEIRAARDTSYSLQMITLHTGSVFLADRLLQSNLAVGDTFFLPLSELQALSPTDSVLRITFYPTAKEVLLAPPSLYIVSDKGAAPSFVGQESTSYGQLYIRQPNALYASNTLLYLLITWSCFVAYLYAFRKNFSLTTSIGAWFVWLNLPTSEEDITFFDLLVLLAVYSAIFSFAAFYATGALHESLIALLNNSDTFWGKNVMISTLVFIWVVLRFVTVSLLSVLFDKRSLFRVFVQEWYRLSPTYIWLVLLAITLCTLGNIPPYLWLSWLVWGGSGLHSFFVLLNVNSVLKIRKVYLFSYFCATEMIPIVLGMKFFMVF